MSKEEFLAQLRRGLAGLPQEDVEERLTFYSETIDDRIEEGLTEEAAVADVGDVDEIAAQIVAETPLPRLVKERARTKRALRTREIVLLVLGSPLWLSLLIAAGAVLLAAYAVIWSLIAALWAMELAVVACLLAGVVAGAVSLFRGGLSGLLLSGGLFSGGLAILLFFGCKAATAALLRLTRRMARGIKSLFIRKENNV